MLTDCDTMATATILEDLYTDAIGTLLGYLLALALSRLSSLEAAMNNKKPSPCRLYCEAFWHTCSCEILHQVSISMKMPKDYLGPNVQPHH